MTILKITTRIKANRDAIKVKPGGGIGKKIREQSVLAILSGMGRGKDWETYMRNFSSNDAQLSRLLGEDQAFMNHPEKWGQTILAYIAGSGPCGGGTALGLADDMPTDLKDFLDDVPDNTFDPSKSDPLSDELKLFLKKEAAQIDAESRSVEQNPVADEPQNPTEDETSENRK